MNKYPYRVPFQQQGACRGRKGLFIGEMAPF